MNSSGHEVNKLSIVQLPVDILSYIINFTFDDPCDTDVNRYKLVENSTHAYEVIRALRLSCKTFNRLLYANVKCRQIFDRLCLVTGKFQGELAFYSNENRWSLEKCANIDVAHIAAIMSCSSGFDNLEILESSENELQRWLSDVIQCISDTVEVVGLKTLAIRGLHTSADIKTRDLLSRLYVICKEKSINREFDLIYPYVCDNCLSVDVIQSESPRRNDMICNICTKSLPRLCKLCKYDLNEQLQRCGCKVW